ncbi:unnamed protein product [Cylindrotheca closterium]|uniref:Uncharacterized protein n=1 Tax=Cylindrotheca closterium TaxID=2856 RepID=A0AAD2FKP1_9STRA|nr:unnamed protein product [Cylindrotheca closterium]
MTTNLICPPHVSSILLLLLLLLGWQPDQVIAIRGLKKGANSVKGDPSLVDFEMCAALIPINAQNPELAVFFDLEDTCTTTFWENQEPWTNGSPLYTAYYPVCSCVILAKDCFLPAVSTFAPMYDVARSTGLLKEEAIAFASPFVESDCLAYALAFLDQWASDEPMNNSDDPPSND